MKIAVCSDEPHAVNFEIADFVKKLGHEVVLFGSLKTKQEESWVSVTHNAAEFVSKGFCDEGIFFCWTGTGASIAANKVPGIRAALCTDVETAIGARRWNKANVLVLSNRLVSIPLAKEIVEAWLSSSYNGEAESALTELKKLEF